jgi:hypothetical protein
MSDAPTIEWEGQSGTKYTYWIYPLGTTFKAEPGNYIFAKESKPNSFSPIYIGETGDLSERFDSHHKQDCIDSNQASHIHVHKNDDGEVARRAEESDLIAKWNPPCNG